MKKEKKSVVFCAAEADTDTGAETIFKCHHLKYE